MSNCVDYVMDKGCNPNGDEYWVIDELVDGVRYDATVIVNENSNTVELDELYKLELNNDGYFERTDEVVDAGIINEFMKVINNN